MATVRQLLQLDCARGSYRTACAPLLSKGELDMEGIMGNYDDDKKRQHGRQYDQLTQDGTGSAASVGPGGTGDLGRSLQQSGQGGSQQSGSRMDDLLGSSDDNARDLQGAGEPQAGASGNGRPNEDTQSAQGWTGGAMQSDRGRGSNDEVPDDGPRGSKIGRGT